MKSDTSKSVAMTPFQRRRKLALEISGVIEGSPIGDALTAMTAVIANQICRTARSDQVEIIACHYAQLLLDNVHKKRSPSNRSTVQ